MKTTNLKLVETPKNTDLLDNLFQIAQEIERMSDNQNSITVTRSVAPEVEDFKKVKTVLNTMLDLSLKKSRGSLCLLETTQEVRLVPENDDERVKVQILRDGLDRQSLGQRLRNLNKVALDTLFSNNSCVQYFLDTPGNHLKVSATNLNFMNTFVTSFSLNRPIGGSLLVKKVFDDHDICRYDFQSACSNSYSEVLEMWDFDSDQNPNELSNEDSRELRSRVKSLLNDMKVVKEKLDTYISEVSIPASEFFALNDETNAELNELVEVAKQKELRDSQLVRKTVNVGLTLNLEVELDSLGDVEDIKKIISERVQNHLVSHSLNCDLDYYFSDGDHLKVKETTFAGVDVIFLLDEVA
ncbi:hypothetical protein N9399_03225 [Porticoccaceae bacterium]|nr:hypothetical protein [Porticoccaceae bacterium]